MGGGCSSRQGRIVAGRTKAFEGMKIDLCIVGMAKCTEGRAKDNQPDALKGVEGGGGRCYLQVYFEGCSSRGRSENRQLLRSGGSLHLL